LAVSVCWFFLCLVAQLRRRYSIKPSLPRHAGIVPARCVLNGLVCGTRSTPSHSASNRTFTAEHTGASTLAADGNGMTCWILCADIACLARRKKTGWLPDPVGLGGWLCRWLEQVKLFRQNQFAVAGDAQAVFVIIVINDDFALRTEQFSAAEAAAFRSRFPVFGHEALAAENLIIFVVHRNRTINDRLAAARARTAVPAGVQ